MIPKPKRNILLTPGPLTTTDAVKRALAAPDICPREKAFGEVLARLGRDLVRVAHGEAAYEAVLFGASGTGALEAVIGSVSGSDRKILVINNGAYGERLAQIAQVYYPHDHVIEYVLPHTAIPDSREISRRLAADKLITHVAVVHHETTTGLLNPVPEVARAAHANGAAVIVDAMSSFGGVPIDVRKDPYDFIVSCANKCLQGMPGLSFVICARDALRGLRDRPRRSFYLSLWHQYDFFSRTAQTLFTPPVQVAYALEQALKEFFAETQEGRRRRYVASWNTLVAGLRALGLKLLLPEDRQSKLLTAVYEPEDPAFSFTKMHDYLLERGITIYPGKTGQFKTFRVATMGAIDQKDITFFLDQLGAFLRKGKKELVR